MAVGIALTDDMKNISMGPVPVSFATVTGDASYPAGGYPVNGQMISQRGIAGVATLGSNAAGYTLNWNTGTQTLQILGPGGTELAAGTSAALFSWTVLFYAQR
jgi:hypothetical protein